MGSPGRLPEAELLRRRSLIESLHLAGHKPPVIQALLLQAKDDKGNPAPIELTERTIKEHIAAIRRGWLERTRQDANADLKADIIGHLEAVVAESVKGAAAKRGTNLEIAQNKLRLDALAKLTRLTGLDIAKVELSGPGGGPISTDHPADHLSPAEEAARYRRLAELAEAAAAEESGDA